MRRYLTLIWNPHDAVQSGSAVEAIARFRHLNPEWQVAIEHDGMCSFCFTKSASGLDNAYVLPHARGVILGKMFWHEHGAIATPSPQSPRRFTLTDRAADLILTGSGKGLIGRFWGQYVAFLFDRRSGSHLVIRDPSGGLPCQHMKLRGIDVYFARLEDCHALQPEGFSISQRFILSHLYYSVRCTRETPIEEIGTVLPGERIEHHADRTMRSFAWNPLDFCQQNVIESRQEAVSLMHETVRSCIHAWATCFKGVLLSLSGGLDSAILASCLTDVPSAPRVLCRNFYMPGLTTDERRYARLSASAAGFELLEVESGVETEPHGSAALPRTLFPLGWPARAASSAADDKFMAAKGLQAEWTGDGGDEIFFRGASQPTAVDYAWRHGITRKLLSVALDDAVARQLSIWRVLKLARRYGLSGHPWDIRDAVPANHMPLMTKQAKSDARADRQLWHPLFNHANAVPRAKLEHAFLLTLGSNRVDNVLVRDDSPAFLTPLRSQPILELSLRIPTYVLAYGGRDRAVARDAFSAQVPAEIIRRKSKVFGDAALHKEVARNRTVVQERLLDGVLVQWGLIDRKRVETVLSGQISRIQTHITEICRYLSVEEWASHWSRA